MAEVVLKSVSKVFPGNVQAVNEASIEVKDKEFLVLVGPSGCGKSTTLRMVAGLEEITEGEIYIDGMLVNDIPPKDRDIAMVFQNYALYPHMTVYKNMAFGLKLRRFPKKEIDERVREAASILGIEELLDRKPKALSGGQRQRVAVGRAIVRKPKVFLFDEPLSNLDAKLRVQMRAELQKLHTRLQSTVVYVTHDQVEAMTMGDRIVVMRDGNILQVDDPLTLYDHPVNRFVAGFIGSPPMNFIDGEVVRRNGGIYFREGTESSESAFSVKLPERVAAKAEPHVGTVVTLGVRPDDIHDREFAQDADPETVVRTTVDVVEPMGAEIILYLSAGAASLVARVDVHTKAKELQSIDMVFDMEKAHLFEKESEVAIT